MKKIISLALAAAMLTAALCACGGNAADKQVDLAAFYAGLTEKYEVPETPEQIYSDDLVNDDDMWLDGPESTEDRRKVLEEQRDFLREMGIAAYPGLSDIAAEQCLAYVSMMSVSGIEAVLVQVSDAADVDAVKSILQARIDAQVDGDAWYPDAIASWENNSRIVSNGRYVMLIVSSDCDAIVSEFNALFK